MTTARRSFDCDLCGGSSGEFLFSARDLNFRTTPELFSIVRCTSCGTAHTLPRPAEDSLGRYYPPSYYPTGGYAPAYYAKTIRPAQQEKLAIVRRFRSSGTLLDVGSGAGFFVREASSAGFSAQGIEFSGEAVEYGTKEGGVRLTQGDILDAQYREGSFDVVTLWHVLEHLPRPAESLRKIRTLLTRGGILVVAVPNFESLQSRIFQERWYHLEVPRHLFHFTPSSLRSLLTAGSFDVQAEFQRSPEHNWAGILGSLVPLVPANGSITGRLARLVIGRPFARAAAAVEAAIHRGGTFTLVSSSRE